MSPASGVLDPLEDDEEDDDDPPLELLLGVGDEPLLELLPPAGFGPSPEVDAGDEHPIAAAIQAVPVRATNGNALSMGTNHGIEGPVELIEAR